MPNLFFMKRLFILITTMYIMAYPKEVRAQDECCPNAVIGGGEKDYCMIYEAEGVNLRFQTYDKPVKVDIEYRAEERFCDHCNFFLEIGKEAEVSYINPHAKELSVDTVLYEGQSIEEIGILEVKCLAR